MDEWSSVYQVDVPDVSKFFTLFDLPDLVQTELGTHFIALSLFSWVLKELSIQHCFSSGYHLESQSVLNRFYQTLNSVLRSYFKEFENDWDDGASLLLFAIINMTPESLGFCPTELVFNHTVRLFCPLKFLK